MYLCIEVGTLYGKESLEMCDKSTEDMAELTSLTYVSVTGELWNRLPSITKKSPNIVFTHVYTPEREFNYVFYRPALLNGRDIFDVLRAVCGPADVSEAELDRIRREATEIASPFSGDPAVWRTKWWAEPVAALV